MGRRNNKSIQIKAFNAVCSILLISSIIYILFAGFEVIATGILITSLAASAVPVVVAGEGLVEILVGILEALLEGVMVVVECIASIFSGLLG
ncbi:hypothetical protein TDB9533_04821 [Thalassocella blandensis]|nr:hypothetical protein TDB9533_04821 [Thalassocella blandensis]